MELQRLGFNGLDTFDTELPRTGKREFSLSDEETIAELMKNPTLRAGGLFKLGIATANSRLLLEARRRKLAKEEKENKRKEDKALEADIDIAEIGVIAYLEWKDAGKPVDGKGKIKLNLKQAKAIVRALMPAIDPTKKVSEYNAVYKVVNWLESLGNWEEEMEKLDLDAAKRRTAAHKPLFSLS